MTEAEREKLAMELFAAVCDAPPAGRAALLDNKCGNDPMLRQRVEQMLSADGVGLDAIADDFLAGVIAPHQQSLEAPSAEDLIAGDSLDRQANSYRILRLVGEGGMGAVYEAEQSNPRRRVAIKAIRQDLATHAARRRFEYEAQVLARLEHPGIARLYEADARPEDGRIRAYLAMEFVDGLPLDQYAVRHSLDIRGRVKVFLKVCDAVSYAHRRGVIHRDLKPANILVNAEGEPKVLDFGVARTLHEADTIAANTELPRHKTFGTRLTQVGQIIGTLAYMSPEQLDNSAAVDTRTDIYSLGVILHQLLTGKLPIDTGTGGLMSAAGRVIGQIPELIGRHDRSLRGELEAIVATTLEKDPTRRYASVDHLAADLERYRDGLPVDVLSGSRLYVLRKTAWRHRKWLTAGGILLIAMAAFGIVASLQAAANARLASERSTLLAGAQRLAEEKSALAASEAVALRHASAARTEAERRADDLRRSLYATHVGFVRASLERGDGTRVRQMLDACPQDLRHWEWSFLKRTADRSSRAVFLPVDGGDAVRCDVDPALRLAAIGYTGGYRVCRLEDGKVLIEGRAETAVSPALSPDARLVAFASGSAVRLFNVADGALVWSTPFPRYPDARRTVLPLVQFSPDGSRLAVVGIYGDLRILDVANGRDTRPAATIGLPTALLMTPDGRRVLLGDENGVIRAIDADGSIAAEYKGLVGGAVCIAASADGKTLAATGTIGQAVVWDEAHPGEPKFRLAADAPAVMHVAISPDGQNLALCSRDSVCRVIDLRQIGTPAAYVGHTARVHFARIGPNGRQMVTLSEDKSARLWEMPLPPLHRDISKSFVMNVHPLTLPDGEQGVAVATSLGVEVRRLTDDRPVPLEADGRPAVIMLAAMPDAGGRFIVAIGFDGVFRIWDMTGERIATPDNRRQNLAGKLRRTIETGGKGSWAVAISPDGKHLICGDLNKDVRSWNLDTGEELPPIPAPFNGFAMSAGFDASGKVLALGGADGQVKLFNWPERTLRTKAHAGKRRVFAVAFNTTGDELAIAAEGEPATVRSSSDLSVRLTLSSSGEAAEDLAYHPDGQRIAVASGNGQVRLWDTRAGDELLSLRVGTSRVSRVEFTRDGKSMITLGDDGAARLWSAGP